jgi:hypothetical protein
LEYYQKRGGALPPQDFARAITLVSDWSSDIRYDPKEIGMMEARAFFVAVEKVYHWTDGRL